MTEWEIDAGHFAERFHLFVIIVLGESIVLTGATATDVGLTSSVVVVHGVAFLSSVAMWWLCFGREATSAVRRIAADEAPGRVGRDAYTYLHLPIVAGILLTAVGDELVITHPGDELGTAGALVVLGGPALYSSGWWRSVPASAAVSRGLAQPVPSCWLPACRWARRPAGWS